MDTDANKRFKRLYKYLPKDKWNVKRIIKDAEEIKRDADSDSAALNRIFDLIKPQSVWDFLDSPSFTTNVGGREWKIQANVGGKKFEVRQENPGGDNVYFEIDMDKAEKMAVQYAGEDPEYDEDEEEFWDEEAPEEVNDDF